MTIDAMTQLTLAAGGLNAAFRRASETEYTFLPTDERVSIAIFSMVKSRLELQKLEPLDRQTRLRNRLRAQADKADD